MPLHILLPTRHSLSKIQDHEGTHSAQIDQVGDQSGGNDQTFLNSSKYGTKMGTYYNTTLQFNKLFSNSELLLASEDGHPRLSKEREQTIGTIEFYSPQSVVIVPDDSSKTCIKGNRKGLQIYDDKV